MSVPSNFPPPIAGFGVPTPGATGGKAKQTARHDPNSRDGIRDPKAGRKKLKRILAKLRGRG